MFVARATRREQVVRAHQAQHPLAPHADLLGAQPEVHLAMPFAVEGARRQDGANLTDQLVVREAVFGPRFPPSVGDVATPAA